jgi:hypothetical protein
MTLRLRRALYLFVFLLFFSIAPALIFYATGHRYDVVRQKVTSVGALYIKSYPSGSLIYLDGKKTGKKTPNRILNVKPGLHTITVIRDGYVPWQKQLEVKEAQTTFVRDIVLFLKNQPVIQLSSGGSQYIIQDSENAYVYLDADHTIHLTSLISESDYEIPTDPRPDTILAINPSADTILFATGSRWYKVDVNTEKTSQVSQHTLTATKALWDPFNRDIAWLIHNQELSTLNLLTGTFEQRLPLVDDFAFDGSRLITLAKEKDATHVTVYARDTLTTIWEKIIPTNEILHITTVNNNGLITLQGNRSVWLADSAADTVRNFEAKLISWNNERLLLATDFEISYYNHDTGILQLIDRGSEALDAILWHPSGSYFLWKKGGVLSLVEIDGRNVRNTISLDAPTINTFHLIFNKKGSKIFILEPESNQLLTLQ